jgi:putative selenium metabolism hydrolase
MTLSATGIVTAAREMENETLEFLREIIRIPSFSGSEGDVVKAIQKRMDQVGFDETKVDAFGNVMGRIGNGSRVLAFDAHIDTVEVGDARLWKRDPFAADVQDGIVYGRGASDQKGGMAALVYAGALLKKLAIEGDMTIWIVGSVNEEDCDGLCWHYILNEKQMNPELVVLTEPTNLELYRGQRGRMEINVTVPGLSCHGSAPERGINAVHRMAPALLEIDRLNKKLPGDPFLGAGSVTTSRISSTSPSLCAVADSCTIHLDRRLTAGETDNSALEGIREIFTGLDKTNPELAKRTGEAILSIPVYEQPSHTGLVYPMRQYFPAWALPESHQFTQMGLDARRLSIGEAGTAGKWTFSTNGVATMGLHNVPTIGFGPANEIHAHAPTDQCPVDHLSACVAFYTTFAALFGGAIK